MKKINSISFLGLVALSINFISAHAGEDEFNHHGMMSNFYGMNFFGWLFMILILITSVLFIAWLIKELTKKSKRK